MLVFITVWALLDHSCLTTLVILHMVGYYVVAMETVFLEDQNTLNINAPLQAPLQ